MLTKAIDMKRGQNVVLNRLIKAGKDKQYTGQPVQQKLALRARSHLWWNVTGKRAT
jgi:hypothetical protein